MTETTKPSAHIEPRAELKDNKKAIADMAAKYSDKKEESSDDDSSSFEEVPQPISRMIKSESTKPATLLIQSTPKSEISQGAGSQVPTATSQPHPTSHTPTTSISINARPNPTGALDGLKSHLVEIKSAQSDALQEIESLKSQIKDLTDVVTTLSTKLDSMVGSQSERIRRVELEVEGLRE